MVDEKVKLWRKITKQLRELMQKVYAAQDKRLYDIVSEEEADK